MKKKLFLINILFLTANISWSQNTNISDRVFEFTYKTVFNFSIDQGQNFRSFESKLFTSDSCSLFFSTPKEEEADPDNNSLDIYITPDTLFKVIKFPLFSSLIFTDGSFSRAPKNYSDTLYPMQWYLRNEKKMIDSLECYMATAFFKGRNYVAWYCPAIAIPDGPWKLGGLPGLIIEAYDNEKQLHFILKRIKVVKDYPADMKKEYHIQSFPNYTNFISDGKNFMKKVREQMGAQPSDCVDCQTSSKIEFHNWENVFF